MKEEVTLLDYWRVIWRYKLLIIGIALILVIVATVYTLRKPDAYRATASILPSTGAGEGYSYRSMAYYRGMSSSEIFTCLLKTSSLREEVRKELIQISETDKEVFVPVPEIGLSDENIIKISITDANPERAAVIANLYVTNLDKFYATFSKKDAGHKRQFIEKRLEEVEKSLRTAEMRLESYNVRHGLSGSRDSSTMASASSLESQLISKKFELDSKLQYTTTSNPEVIRLKREISELEKTVAKIPSMETEKAELMRDLRQQENLYRVLTEQFEQIKVEEVRDLPTVQVLDWAVVPKVKDGPNIKRNIFIATFLSFFLGIFLAFLLDYVGTQRKVLYEKKA